MLGGGAPARHWNQIKADVLGVPYQPLKRSEFGTWGSAMIAGYAVGIYSNLAEIAWISNQPNGPPVTPQDDVHSTYIPLVEKYIGWQATLSNAFHSFG